MNLIQTSYTKLRENLAPYLRKVSSDNSILEVIWRNNEPCIVMTKKNYLDILNSDTRNGHGQEEKPLHDHVHKTYKKQETSHGQKNAPASYKPSPQTDLFE